MILRQIQKELGAQLRNALRSEGLALQVVGPQPMPTRPAVMEEASKNPQGNKIVLILAHEWNNSGDWRVYKVEWKQGY